MDKKFLYILLIKYIIFIKSKKYILKLIKLKISHNYYIKF